MIFQLDAATLIIDYVQDNASGGLGHHSGAEMCLWSGLRN